MKIIIENNIPKIVEVGPGNTIIFFGKIDDLLGYCIVFIPKIDKSLPKFQYKTDYSDMFEAKVAFGKKDEEMTIVDVLSGTEDRKGGFGLTTKYGRIEVFPDKLPLPTFTKIIKEVFDLP